MKNQIRPNFRDRGKGRAVLSTLRLATGTLAIFALAHVHAQNEDLPFVGGSDGSDGSLEVPRHPSTRQGAVLGYDPVRAELVLFGGDYGVYYPETWISTGEAWEKAAHDTFVSARSYAAMGWDANSQRLVMFGGYRADGAVLDEFWAWDGNDWSPIDVSPRPPARYDHSLVVNSSTGDIYIMGGRNASNTNLSDIWRWDGTAWTQLEGIGTPPPSEHRYFFAVYDASDDAIIAYNSAHRRTYQFKDGTWSEIATGDDPNCGHSYSLVYDPGRGSSILFGGTSHLGQTWEFKDGEWAVLSTTSVPPRRQYHAAAYHGAESAVFISLGWMDAFSNSLSSPPNYDTWAFKDGEWEFRSGRLYYFDMTEKPNGIWNFTSINIPSSAEVRFVRNAANTPVVWLAQESVQIDGILRMDGQAGGANNGADNYALGGPGGSPGGLGGTRFDVSGNYAGTPGQGPGGGAPGVSSGQYGTHGQFRNVYGNSLLLPLIGGSGGGGGAANDSNNGGHGGGGGGAILIASDRDIIINGTINASGGAHAWGGASYGGHGSGGSIKLMADRVLGSGSLRALSGGNQSNNDAGRIRIEAFFRPLAANATPPATATAPIETPDFGEMPSLSILSVDGESVALPPTGNLQTPDVVFTAAGTVTVVVGSQNVPEGTPVTLRITSSGAIISLPAAEAPEVTVGADGTASFTATVPAGLGTIQAFAEFTP